MVTLFLIVDKKHYIFMHYWLTLNVHPKWLNIVTNSVKTVVIANENQDGDRTKGGLVPTKRMSRN